MKKKLEESGGLTFQIPQFNTEYGTRRVPTIKKVKSMKEGIDSKDGLPKDRKDKLLKKKLTAKMVGDSLDLILNRSIGSSVGDSAVGVAMISPLRSPGRSKNVFSSAKKVAEKVSGVLNQTQCNAV